MYTNDQGELVPLRNPETLEFTVEVIADRLRKPLDVPEKFHVGVAPEDAANPNDGEARARALLGSDATTTGLIEGHLWARGDSTG